MGLEEYLVLGVQFKSQPPILPAVTSWLPYFPSPNSSWPQLLWTFFFIPIHQTMPFTLSSFFIQPKLHGASLQTLFFPQLPCLLLNQHHKTTNLCDPSMYILKRLLKTAQEKENHTFVRTKLPTQSDPLLSASSHFCALIFPGLCTCRVLHLEGLSWLLSGKCWLIFQWIPQTPSPVWSPSQSPLITETVFKAPIVPWLSSYPIG